MIHLFQMIKENYEVNEVPLESQDVNYRSPDIHLLKFNLKAD